MKFPVLTILLVFILVLAFFIKKSNKETAKKESEFWEKEHDANFTRKKSLDQVKFISLPENILSLGSDCSSENEKELYEKLLTLKDKKIADFNGITNTDLKLAYGASNLTLLSEADQNFSELITLLDQLSSLLISNEKEAPARLLLEFATDIGSDIRSSYVNLALIYVAQDQKSLIHLLIKKAEATGSFRQKRIIAALNDILDDKYPSESRPDSQA